MFLATILMIGASVNPAYEAEKCTLLFDFENQTTIANWDTTNDNVMGGKSSGGPLAGQDSLIFKGSTNTDGGGFSSIKSKIAKKDGTGLDYFKVRYRGDGRSYRFSLETGERRYVFFRIQYWASLSTKKGESWQEKRFNLSDFSPYYMGKPITTNGLKGRRIKAAGFFIYDLKDGPFQLEVGWIKGCRD